MRRDFYQCLFCRVLEYVLMRPQEVAPQQAAAVIAAGGSDPSAHLFQTHFSAKHEHRYVLE